MLNQRTLTLLSFLFLLAASLAQATDYPSFRAPEGNAPSPTDAWNAEYSDSPTHSNSTGNWYEGPSPDVKGLARGLGADRVIAGEITQDEYVDTVYDYVRNTIDVEPLFGLKKGALGAMTDRGGSPFDIVELMAQLLAEAEVSFTYKFGEITIDDADAASWFGATRFDGTFDPGQTAQMLSDAGIPNVDAGAQITIAHVWLSVELTGGPYVFDPAFKLHDYTRATSTALGSILGYSQDFFTNALNFQDGNTNTIDWVEAAKYDVMSAALNGFASNLLDFFDNPANGVLELDDVIGRKRIVREERPQGGWRDTTLPYTATAFVTWGQSQGAGQAELIPDAFRTTLRVKMDAEPLNDATGLTENISIFDETFFSDEIYGERLMIDADPDLSEFELTLKVGDRTVGTPFNRNEPNHGTPQHPLNRNLATIELTVDHPYAEAGGTYADRTSVYQADYVQPITIVHGFGMVSPELRTKFDSESYSDPVIVPISGPGSMYGPTESPPPLDRQPQAQVRNLKPRVEASWLDQFTTMSDIQARLADAAFSHHHTVGLVYSATDINVTTAPNTTPPRNSQLNQEVGIRLDIVHMSVDTAIVLRGKTNDSNTNDRDAAAAHSIAASAAALEASVFEQLLDQVDVSSTADRFKWANATRTGAPDYNTGELKFALLENPGDRIDLTGTGGFKIHYNENDNDYLSDGFKAVVVEKVPISGGIGPQSVGLGPGRASYLGDNPIGGSTEIWNQHGRGRALIAFRPNDREFVHEITGWTSQKGGSGTPDNDQTLKYDPASATEVLKDSFDDRSVFRGVSLASGELSYTPPPDLVVGGREAPYSLAFQRYFNSGTGKSAGMPDGWSHNWDFRADIGGSANEALGESSGRWAVASIAAFYAMQDIYLNNRDDVRNQLYGALVTHWWKSYTTFNVATIRRGQATELFARVPSTDTNSPEGEWIAPDGSGSTLLVRDYTYRPDGSRQTKNRTNSLARSYNYDGMVVEWQGPQADKVIFRLVELPPSPPELAAPCIGQLDDDGNISECGQPVDSEARRTKATFVGVSWQTARGLNVTLAWDETYLTSVSNNAGRQLTFTYGDADNTQPSVQDLEKVSDGTRDVLLERGIVGPRRLNAFVRSSEQGEILSQVTLPDTTVWRYAYIGNDGGPGDAPSGQKNQPTPLLYEVYEPVFDADLPQDGQALIRFVYDGRGFVREFYDAEAILGTRLPYRFAVARNAFGTRTDPTGATYTVSYDQDGRAIRFVDERDRVFAASYDSWNRVIERTYPEGNKTQFGYDERSNTTLITHVGKNGVLTRSASAVYNTTFNKPDSVTDFRQKTTAFYYVDTGQTECTTTNGTGELCKVKLPAPEQGAFPTTRPEYDFSYNGRGVQTRIIGKIDPTTSTETVFTLAADTFELLRVTADSDEFLPGITDRLNLTTYFDVDATGNIDGRRDPRSASESDATYLTTTTFDAMRRPTRVYGPTLPPENPGDPPDLDTALTDSFTAYDEQGREVRRSSKVTTPAGLKWMATCTVFTATGQPKEVVGPYLVDTSDDCPIATDVAVPVTTYLYDGVDREIERRRKMGTGEADRVTRTYYFPDGQVERIVKAYGTSLRQDYATYTYTPNGKVESVTDANSNTTEYEYDEYDRLALTRFPGPLVESYEYDDNGNRTKLIKRSGDEIEYIYDSLNRLIITDVGGTADTAVVEADYTTNYDLLGRAIRTCSGTLVTVNCTGDHAVAMTYDNANRLTEERQGGRLIRFRYDDASNRTRITWPNDAFIAQYDYDGISRLTDILELGPTSRALAHYDYDELSRVKDMTLGPASEVMTTIGYEADGQLDSIFHDLPHTGDDVTYSFEYNRVNQIINRTIDNAAYVWAPTESATFTTTVNALNQYQAFDNKAVTHDANGNMDRYGARLYQFDLLNRLTRTQPNGAPTETRIYEYDGASRLRRSVKQGIADEYLYAGDQRIALYVDNDLEEVYVPGAAGDDHIAAYTLDSNTTEFLPRDHLSSVVAAVSSAGVQKFSYSAFGEPSTLAGPVFRFTGQALDPEGDLHYFKARHYSPEMGRFLQTDPIGYEDQMNLYAYVHNRPLTASDPSGRQTSFDIRFRAREKQFLRDRNEERFRSENQAEGVGGVVGAGVVAAGVAAAAACGAGGCAGSAILAAEVGAGEALGPAGVAGATGLAAKSGVLEDVAGFVKDNLARLNQKLGAKIGQGRLPFALGREGRDDAVRAVEETLANPSQVSDTFVTRGGDEAFDVFSEKTGMTVRVRTDGTFDTLIDEKSSKFSQ